MRKRPKSDPIDRLRRADPAPPEQASDAARDAARERTLTLAQTDAPLAGETREPRRSPRLALPVAAVTTVGVAVVGVAVLVLDGDAVGPGPESAFAKSAVEVADGNPRLLVGEPGWSVSYAGEFEPDQGYMDFRHDQDPGELTVDWAPAEYYSDPFDYPGADPGQWYRSQIGCFSDDRAADDCRIYSRLGEIEVLGTTAPLQETRIVEPNGSSTNSFQVPLPPSGDVYVRISARGMSAARFAEVVGTLYGADVETWLAALPPNTVRPLERPEVVDEMAAGLPIPESVDIGQLKDESAALSRYNLGADVSAAVACGWLDQWAAATGPGGDEVAAEEAVEAMATSRSWPLLEEMASQGGWSQVVWEYAADMRRGDRKALLGTAGTETLPDGRVYETGPSYASGLGCDSEQRTLREQRAAPPTAVKRAQPVRSPEADLKKELPPTGNLYPEVEVFRGG